MSQQMGLCVFRCAVSAAHFFIMQQEAEVGGLQMDNSNALKKQIEFELITEIKKGRARIKELKDKLSFNYQVSGTFKGLGSGMAQSSVNKSSEETRTQIENAEYAIAWYEDIAKRYHINISGKD